MFIITNLTNIFSAGCTGKLQLTRGGGPGVPPKTVRWGGTPVAEDNRAGDRMACNDGDRRQWRKQGAIVGAAASKTQAVAKRMLGAATRTRV